MNETRRSLIQRIQRVVLNDYPEQNTTITEPLVNKYINDAIAVAAKNNYIESIKLDGVSYVNNSFYTTFKGLTITQDEVNVYKFSLPNIPVGLGRNEGVASVIFKDNNNNKSYDAIPLSINQKGYSRGRKPIPNKVLYWYENNVCYAESTFPLTTCTAIVRMISGSNSDSLDSVINVPSEWLPQIIEYCVKTLILERNQPQDLINDGRDLANK